MAKGSKKSPATGKKTPKPKDNSNPASGAFAGKMMKPKTKKGK